MADAIVHSADDLRRFPVKWRDMGDGTMSRVVYAVAAGANVADVTSTPDKDMRRLPIKLKDMGDGTYAEVVAVAGLPEGGGISQSQANGTVQAVTNPTNGQVIPINGGAGPVTVDVRGSGTLTEMTFNFPAPETPFTPRERDFFTRRAIGTINWGVTGGGTILGGPLSAEANTGAKFKELEPGVWASSDE